jgi:crotonobetainyl-CoA:carnitine CoA-transferase CaiB-like acyl-CoA transferase
MEPHVPAFQQLGIIASRAGPRLPGSAPNSIYPTRDDSFITITAASDAVFRRLALVMGREDMITDPRFSSAVARAKNVAACDDAVAAWTVTKDAVALETQLETAKVPAARIYSMADIFADPHYKARDMLVDVVDDVLGNVTVAGVVPKLSRTPGQIRWVGRDMGADTREILSQDLQLSDEEINALMESGVIASGAAVNSNDEH